MRSRRFFVRPWKRPGEHVLHVDVDFLDRRPGDDLEGREALLPDVDLDLLVIEPPVAELLAQLLARALRLLPDRRGLLVVVGRGGSGGSSRSSTRSSAACRAFSRTSASRSSLTMSTASSTRSRTIDSTSRPDVADLGELRRFDLDERRLREPREAARDLGLADARRADHQDVLRRDLFGDLRRKLLPARAIAQRNRDRAFGLRLPDHVFVELGDDLPRGERLGRRCGGFWKINGHAGTSAATFSSSSIVIVALV